MPVVVKLSPLLRKYVTDYDHDEGIVVPDGAGKKVGELAATLSIPKEKITMVMVNHRPSRISHIAREDDLILLGLIIGGG